MNKMMTAVAAAALATASVSASAWWGWGPGGWDNDVAGDAGLNADARSQGWGRYYDYYAPYWAYPQGGAAPYALSPEQQKSLSEQQKAFAEQQAQFLKQAVEAQRKLAEQWAANPHPAGPVFAPAAPIHEMERQLMERAAADQRELFDRVRKDLAAHPAPFTAPADLGTFEDRVKEMDAQREQSKKEMDAQFEQSKKEMAARRQETAKQREEAVKQMEARREESLRRFEAQREATQQRHSATL